MKKMYRIILFALIAALTMITMVSGQNDGFNVPLGAENITEIRSETANTSRYYPSNVSAIAGNLTELHIQGVTQTKKWQGFFGNITGTLILEDSSGFRFYDWEAAEPQGQVYAATVDSINWVSVDCANISDVALRSDWYSDFGMNDSDYDNINMTYNATDHPEITVGGGQGVITGCRTTYTFVSNTRQFADFPALLLADSNNALIFTAIIEDRARGIRGGKTGYDGRNYDFQLLVAEDGYTSGNNAVTPYYFWLELS